MRVWICLMDAPNCYKHTAWVERKITLQDSELVRTVGPCYCAQRRVALMPQAIARVRSNDRHESTTRFERPAEQALALATKHMCMVVMHRQDTVYVSVQ